MNSLANGDHPVLRQTVLDCVDPRRTADFYRLLLGYHYRSGDEPELAGGDPRAGDWLVLLDRSNNAALAFQRVQQLPEPTWPEPAVAQQLHLDMTVADRAALDRHHRRVIELGGRMLLDRGDDPIEALRVYRDPEGHPFCIFVADPA